MIYLFIYFVYNGMGLFWIFSRIVSVVDLWVFFISGIYLLGFNELLIML